VRFGIFSLTFVARDEIAIFGLSSQAIEACFSIGETPEVITSTPIENRPCLFISACFLGRNGLTYPLLSSG
jgi:hypothetical protein